ncbi:hypothetical protein PAXRUDRAFT_155910 [Paxillus rubicundulus Ve08.2h10]|uniref:Unplaced genomic scaffold scaffold_959, whole genome shotgun sequence n=1 Tax=Paxillus rubicundulus Ve08.2h10 TaxID=930991 RepID=A0A0D0DIW6_9AGAM|nr:hypothetical protein PAXRUDRAFT_155910 [Paxillus rubicundulus Ve08.2h10]
MLYGIDIWGTDLIGKGKGKKENGWGARGFGKKVERVQRLATILVTGGMSMTATDLLNASTNFLPAQLQICHLCHRATLQMAMLSPPHPLSSALAGAKCNCKRHKSPLHRLLAEFSIDPQTMEKIIPLWHYPKWQPDTIIDTKDDEAEAVLQDILAEEEEEVCLYSDGSGLEGGISRAAVLRRGGEKKKSLRFYLGKAMEHTVYEGELVGMILALELLKEE